MSENHGFAKAIKFLGHGGISPISWVRDCDIDRTSVVKGLSRVYSTSMGRYSYIGRGCLVQGVQIGSFCSIADNCTLGSPGHELGWVSTSPVFQGPDSVLGKSFANHGFSSLETTEIASDVWIGNNVTVLGGKRIGVGAVVGAGAVVTKDIEPYAIVGGNPARVIRFRFDDRVIAGLLDSRWWELENDDLALLGSAVIDPLAFVEAVAELRGKRHG